MSATLIGALLLLAPPKPDPDQFPWALHRSMEIDDLDREIERLHDTVLLKQGQLATSQRMAQRGLISRSNLERDLAALRYDEAREAEACSFRVLKAYERDVLGGVRPSDESRAYDLLLDWLKKREAIAQVDVDYRGFTLKQTRALYGATPSVARNSTMTSWPITRHWPASR